MSDDMTYDETVKLEAMVEMKNKADSLYNDFCANVELRAKDYKGAGRFEVWSDSHNTIYVVAGGESFLFQCRFLHESYNITITPSCIFDGIKDDYKGVGHLASYIKQCKKQ